MAKQTVTVEVANKELGKAEIAKCSCKHPWQDKKYGHNMRVHNRGKKGLRCTVCKNVRSR